MYKELGQQRNITQLGLLLTKIQQKVHCFKIVNIKQEHTALRVKTMQSFQITKKISFLSAAQVTAFKNHNP